MVGQFTMVMSILIHPWKLTFGTQKRRFVYDVPFQKGKVICRFKMLISRVYKSSHIPSSNHPMISNRIVFKTSLKNSDKWGDRPLLVREIGKFPWKSLHAVGYFSLQNFRNGNGILRGQMARNYAKCNKCKQCRSADLCFCSPKLQLNSSS